MNCWILSVQKVPPISKFSELKALLKAFSFTVVDIDNDELFNTYIQNERLGCDVFITSFLNSEENREQQKEKEVISLINKYKTPVFVIIYDEGKALDREVWFDSGCHMVSTCLNSIRVILKHIVSVKLELEKSLSSSKKTENYYDCPICLMSGLSKIRIWEHTQYYHSYTEDVPAWCNICNKENKRYQVHMFEHHGPEDYHVNSNTYPPLLSFAFIVCQRIVKITAENGEILTKKQFLLVQEARRRGFWIPGGHVDPGEHVMDAAIRETKEEAGVDINLDGILKIDYIPYADCTRLNVIFLASPKDKNSAFSKTLPDFESSGACWVESSELKHIRLRSKEPAKWFPKLVSDECNIYPLSLLN